MIICDKRKIHPSSSLKVVYFESQSKLNACNIFLSISFQELNIEPAEVENLLVSCILDK